MSQNIKQFKFNLIIPFALLILLITGLTACQQKQPENAFEGTETNAPAAKATDADIARLLASLNMHHFKKPVKAPDFKLESVNGGTVSLDQFKGDVLLISFWATW